jgi:hypothetical protein
MHRIACFLPPYMLRQITHNDTPEPRTRAAQTLVVTEQFRAQRALLPRVSPPAASIQSAGKQRQVYTAAYSSNLPGRLVRAEGNPPLRLLIQRLTQLARTAH